MNGPWEWLLLEDVLVKQSNRKVIQQGWSPKCHEFPARGGAWGVLKTTAIQPGHFNPEHNKELPVELEPKPQIEVRCGDLLLTCAGPRVRCGVPALVRSMPERLMMSGKMYRLRPDDRIDPRFLEYWLLSPVAQKHIDKMKTGISESGLNLTHGRFVKLPVPLPPLDEQRRVVNFLEDHLSRLDAAKASLSLAIRKLDAMVTSSLAAHTTAEGQSLHHSTVGAEAELVEYGSSAKCIPEEDDSSVPVLRMGNLQGGELVWDSLKYLPAGHEQFPKLLLKRGDLLFNRTNSAELVGKSAVFDGDMPVSFASYLIRVRFKTTVNPAWANMVINSPAGRNYVASVVSQQVGQANVNSTKLKAFPLPVPDRGEQDRRVREHYEVLSNRNHLRQAINDSLARSAALRCSLLAAAFSGRLTGSTPDLSEAMEAIIA